MPGFELIGKEERDAVIDIFDKGGILYERALDEERHHIFRVKDFENAFKEKIGASYAQAVTSGKLNKCVARFKCAYTPFSPTPQPREKDDRASYPRAWSRSRIKSSTDSSPTDKRITSGPAPAAKSCSSFNWRWVVEAG